MKIDGKEIRGAGVFVLFTVLAAIVYGVAHDLITAHISVEYFLPPYHPQVIHGKSPVLLALLWGTIATWWAGLLLSIPMALANLLGRAAHVPWGRMCRRVGIMLAIIWGLAMAILAVSLFLFSLEFESTKERAVAAVEVTHLWSYGASFVGASLITGWTIRERRRA